MAHPEVRFDFLNLPAVVDEFITVPRFVVAADAVALEQDERFGIWGGLSERERRRLKKRAV